MSSVQCAALAAAMQKKGVSYQQIASGIGSTEQHVVEVVTGKVRPTEAEFNNIARYLGITNNVSHTGVHATT